MCDACSSRHPRGCDQLGFAIDGLLLQLNSKSPLSNPTYLDRCKPLRDPCGMGLLQSQSTLDARTGNAERNVLSGRTGTGHSGAGRSGTSREASSKVRNRNPRARKTRLSSHRDHLRQSLQQRTGLCRLDPWIPKQVEIGLGQTSMER